MNTTTIVPLGRALLHFLWQGSAIALIAGLAGAALRRSRPAVRYGVYAVAMAAMPLFPIATFFVVGDAPVTSGPAAPVVSAAARAAATAAPIVASARRGSTALEPVGLVWLVRVWLAGVAIVGARSLVGWAWAQRLRTFRTSAAPAGIERAAARLASRLGLRRAARVVMTAASGVPATLGWLRPVVLLPVSAVTALTPAQIELLIAHELAHVRRHDYLVNLAQTAIETVLFYHPAVWWLSSRIRMEREHCCDDLAVEACGDVASYVRALAALEGTRTARAAVLVTANGGPLLGRIQRLLHRERREGGAPPAWLGALVPAALVLAAVVSSAPQHVAEAAAPKSATPPAGFLAGLADAGYTHLSVNEIIALKDHGVEPGYAKDMAAAGLGAPDVEHLITLREHGVEPRFVASMARSGLVSDLDFSTVIHLRENDVRGEDLLRIHALGFGPFTSVEVIRLRQNGVDAGTFEALKEAGAVHAGVRDAIEFRQNDVTTDRIVDMKKQGFNNMTLEQILKLRRGGII